MFNVRPSFLCIALGLAMAACGGAGADDDAAATSGDPSSEDEIRATSLAGTYDVGNGTGTSFNYDKLTLKANHTFTAIANCGDTVAVHCMSIRQISGTWSTTESGPQLGSPGGAAQIVFKATGDGVSTYFYSLSGKNLRLSATFRGKFSLFIKDGGPFPKVGVGDVCSDTLGNITAACPDNFACEFDGSKSKQQRCWPDF